MQEPAWDAAHGAWRTRVKSPAVGRVDVLIYTDGPNDLPTPQQLAAVETITGLDKEIRRTLRTEARRYARTVLDPEEYEECEPEDFRVEFSTAVVPRLRAAESAYFFLQGSWDIDFEHGVAFLSRNGVDFRGCDTGAVYEQYTWDAVDDLEKLLGGRG